MVLWKDKQDWQTPCQTNQKERETDRPTERDRKTQRKHILIKVEMEKYMP